MLTPRQPVTATLKRHCLTWTGMTKWRPATHHCLGPAVCVRKVGALHARMTNVKDGGDTLRCSELRL
jgi:hypothetical protein